MVKEKRMLVKFQECCRPVTFMSASELESDPDLLLKEIFKAFDDPDGETCRHLSADQSFTC